MPWVLRQSNADTNPTLPGGIYGEFITAGRMVYWFFDGTNTKVILFISDGGRYGLDAIHTVEYNGDEIDEFTGSVRNWKFHRGLFTKQIEPKAVTAVDVSTDVFTCTQSFTNGDEVRFHARDGTLPTGLVVNTKYFVISRTATTFQVSATSGGSAIDITALGTGSVTVWKADAGIDDPEQGYPELLTQIKTTFSGIAYLEIKLPTAASSADAPDEAKFRVLGNGRRLMDYEDDGSELGIVGGTAVYNPALQLADTAIVDYKKPISRFDWLSWKAFKDASEVLIWQRANPDISIAGTGLVGRYYKTKIYPEDFSSPRADFNDPETVLKFTRLDATIDFDWGTGGPGGGLGVDWFGIIWEGKIKFEYSETYTFTINHDQTVRLYVDGQLLMEYWDYVTGTHTGSITVESGRLYSIRIEYSESWHLANIDLKWSSPSLALEIVPAAYLYPNDAQVKRYQSHMAFPEPTEAQQVFANILQRCPGWNWTDKNGKITFLPPDRPIVYEFIFDPNDDDKNSTLLATSAFEQKRKKLIDRKNFRLFKYRNFATVGFPTAYIQANRPRLREISDISPDNDSATQLGVMTESQASRIAENTMVLQTDSRHSFPLQADRRAGKVSKMELVSLKYYLKGDIVVANATALATSVNRNGDTVEFTLMPVPDPFYTDEVV